MLNAAKALTDNYIWYWQLIDDTWAVVDPGDAAPILQQIPIEDKISHILLTHHHSDHTSGVKDLKEVYPKAKVFGPKGASKYLDKELIAGDEVIDFKVIDTPGHTLDHIVYVNDEIILLGDHIFKYGCGRIFEGNLSMMYNSLEKIKDLAPHLMCYPAHEYTLDNLLFTKKYCPFNKIDAEIEKVKQMDITLPMILKEQLLNNPFLSCSNLDEFSRLRQLRDTFRSL